MGKRARMEGFNTLDHWDHYHEAAAQLAEWLAAGTLKYREHVLDGLDRAPEALVRLFSGDHLGKLVVSARRSARVRRARRSGIGGAPVGSRRFGRGLDVSRAPSRGRRTRNVAPSPGAVCTSARPPCASAIAATIASPSPAPPLARVARRIGAPEPLEHAGRVLVGHARALVGDLDHRVVAVDADAHVAPACRRRVRARVLRAGCRAPGAGGPRRR